jgi:hypothetical protein
VKLLTEIGGGDFGKLETRSPKINEGAACHQTLESHCWRRNKARLTRLSIKKITLKIRCAAVEFLAAGKSVHPIADRYSGF